MVKIIIDLIIIAIISYCISAYWCNKPKLLKTSVSKNANYGKKGLVIDDKDKSFSKVNIIYYVPDYEIAFTFLNVKRKKIDCYSDMLIELAEDYIRDMNEILDKNMVIGIREEVRNDIRQERLG